MSLPTPLKTIIPERERDTWNRFPARRVEVVVLPVDLRESLIDVCVVWRHGRTVSSLIDLSLLAPFEERNCISCQSFSQLIPSTTRFVIFLIRSWYFNGRSHQRRRKTSEGVLLSMRETFLVNSVERVDRRDRDETDSNFVARSPSIADRWMDRQEHFVNSCRQCYSRSKEVQRDWTQQWHDPSQTKCPKICRARRIRRDTRDQLRRRRRNQKRNERQCQWFVFQWEWRINKDFDNEEKFNDRMSVNGEGLWTDHRSWSNKIIVPSIVIGDQFNHWSLTHTDWKRSLRLLLLLLWGFVLQSIVVFELREERDEMKHSRKQSLFTVGSEDWPNRLFSSVE